MKRKNYHFAAVVSEFHRDFTEAMLQAAERELVRHELTVVWVPGSFEIPLQVQRLARTGQFDAVLALGLVWQGETLHNTEILRAVTDALMRISLETNVPVVHEVLSVSSKKQAKERTCGKLSRGREAALAALAVAHLGK